jgi:hypothetical protein
VTARDSERVAARRDREDQAAVDELRARVAALEGWAAIVGELLARLVDDDLAERVAAVRRAALADERRAA